MTTPFTFDLLDSATTLALDASAGTGKTHTLTTIALRLIADGHVRIEQLLIVTFTNAATAELKLRILTTLKKARQVLDGAIDLDEATRSWLYDTDEATRTARRANIHTAIMTFDDASIVTIHGFCQRMLTYVGVSAGMSRDAAVTDDDTHAQTALLDDLTAGVIGQRNATQTAFLLGAARLKRRNIDDLARQVLQLSELRLVDDHWLNTPLDTIPAVLSALDQVFALWTDAFAAAKAALPTDVHDLIADTTRLLDDPFFAQDSRQKTYVTKAIVPAATALATWLSRDQPVPPVTLKKIKGPQANAPYVWFTTDAFRQCGLDGESPDHLLVTVCEQLATARHQVITQARNLMAHAITMQYRNQRRNRHVLTYDDLLQQVYAALTDDTRAELTRQILRTQYTMALIDEFQDTDQVQWGIFSRLFEPHDPLIVIGDPKQAIYQFRGADVATYLRARDMMRQVYTLDTNWRSDTDHVDAVNAVFQATNAFDPYGITFTPSAATHPNRLSGPQVKSGITVRAMATDGEQPPRVMNRIVDDVAEYVITVLTDTMITNNDTVQPLSPGDVAVLVRTNHRARQVRQALIERGVPATIQRGGSVFHTADAAALHQLLCAIARPYDIKLVCGAAAGDLIQLPATVLAAINDGTANQEHTARFNAFTDQLVVWQEQWRRNGVFACVMAAVSAFAVNAHSERTLINVRHLAELLETESHAQQLGLDGVLGWFATKRAEVDDVTYRADDSDELRLDAGDNAVKIATVHSAKGLEYPVVLACDLWMKAPDVKPGLTVFTDPQASPYPKPTLDLAIPAPTAAPSLTRTWAERDRAAEQVRLAYVALTRAAHATVVWVPDGTPDTTAPLGVMMATMGTDPVDPNALDTSAISYAERFQEIATHWGAAITVTTCERLSATQYPRHDTVDVTFTTRTQRRTRFDTPHRHTSFSALTRHHDSHASVIAVTRSQAGDDDRDHTLSDVVTDSTSLPLATFPRGTRAGNLLHSVFEHLDFAQASTDTVRNVLIATAEQSRFASIDVVTATDGILQVIDTPLGQPCHDATLRQIPRHARADEMPFTVPLATRDTTVTLAQLAPVLATSRDPLLTRLAERLTDERYRTALRGFLSGSIDALLRLPDGRYTVVDYKSNYIQDSNGDTHVACYAPDALADTMTEHLYTLQALVYLIATHRYLSGRVDGYSPQTHLAGANYLFLRGMIGPATPVRDGQRYGVATVTIEPELLIDINRIIAGQGRS